MGKKLLFVAASVVVAVAVAVSKGWFKPLSYKGAGFAAPGWNRVAQVFKQQVESGYHKGGGFAVYHNGQLVMEFVGGYADYEAEWPWDKTTLSCYYSCTKGIAAIAAAILVDRGLLNYSAPVAKYWPEFAQNGKEHVTVEQLLSHQAGLIVLDEVFSYFDLLSKPDKLSSLLASAKPQWVPGTEYGSHGLTFGLYVDFLVRRVDPHHRSIDQFVDEEISRKFGIDLFIGLPKEENYRCARIHENLFVMLFNMLKIPKYWRLIYAALFDPDSRLQKSQNNCADSKRNLQNNPTFREIPSASTHGFGTVASFAQIYGILANGGSHDNLTLLSPAVIQKLNEGLFTGIDSVFLGNLTAGRGTIILKSKDGYNIFGNLGYGGQAVFADPKHKLGWSYLTNNLNYFAAVDDWRYQELLEAMYETVFEMEKWQKSKS